MEETLRWQLWVITSAVCLPAGLRRWSQQHNWHVTVTTLTAWLRGALLGEGGSNSNENCWSSSSCDVTGVGSSWRTVSYIFLTFSFAFRSFPRRVSQLSVRLFLHWWIYFRYWSVSVGWRQRVFRTQADTSKSAGVGKSAGLFSFNPVKMKLTWIKDSFRSAQSTLSQLML